jgi:hypothetical protein
MKRVIQWADWEKNEPERLRIAQKLGFVERQPLERHPTKSKAKMAVLQALYGPSGQDFRRES